jgi:heat shock protein HslJ
MTKTILRAAAAVSALALLAACETYSPGGPGAPSLVGSRWIAQTVDGAPAFGERPITLYFAPEGRVDGNSGCNAYFGAYVINGPRFDITDVGSTKMACAPDLMRQEAVYLNVLSTADRYGWATDGRLTVAAPNGQSVVFTPDTYYPR